MAEQLEAVLVRAAQLTTSGRPRAAIELLRPMLTAHPEHAAAWCRLSVACLDAGALDEALDAAKRAIMLGERSWAHRLASLALVELERYPEAVASAREAARREPMDWRCHVTLAEALGPTAPGGAVVAARRAVHLAPNEVRPHEVLGDAAARTGDVPMARRAYRDALRLDPGNGHVQAGLARLSERPAPVAEQPVRRPVRFGRVQRVAVWLLVRRVAMWLAVGSFLLLVAGLPRPSPLLGWLGLGLLLFVPGVAAHGWLRLPAGSRVGLGVLRRVEPLAPIAVVSLCVSMLLLLVWTGALVLGAQGMGLLGGVLAGALGPAALGWVCLWRLMSHTR
ncbi:MAG TPA: tetratricopeptide repeat protein [Actinophytocola sp.]|jgi:Flp pilus assembly protein TadD|uniref:tetratricopeptide repeat protein n=1 Tax=Actinophytocola sp. TaxID=1872138 RepID=UPI002DFACDD8|nr:tetratricopeptide repeat protein [Actinophytocola sp.]